MTNFKKLAMLCAALFATTSLAFATGCDLLPGNSTSESTGTSESISNSESASASESTGTSESTSDSTSEVEPEPVIEDLGVTYSIYDAWNGYVSPEDYDENHDGVVLTPYFAFTEESEANLTLNLAKGGYLIQFILPEYMEGKLEVGESYDSLTEITSYYAFANYAHGDVSLFVQYSETYDWGTSYGGDISYRVYAINEVETTKDQGTATLLANVFTPISFSVEEDGRYRFSTSAIATMSEYYLVVEDLSTSTIITDSMIVDTTYGKDFTIYVQRTSLKESYEFDWKIELLEPVEVEDGDTVTLNKDEDVEILFDGDETKAYRIEIETDSDYYIDLKAMTEYGYHGSVNSLVYEFDGADAPVSFMVYYSSSEENAPETLDVTISITEVGATGDRAEDVALELGYNKNTFVVMTTGRTATATLSEDTYYIEWDNTNVSVSLNNTALTNGSTFDYTPVTDDEDNTLDAVFAIANSAETTQTVNLIIKKYYPTISVGAENSVTIDPTTASNIYGMSYVEVEFIAPASKTYTFTTDNTAAMLGVMDETLVQFSSQSFNKGEAIILLVLVRGISEATTINVTVAEKAPFVIGTPYTDSVNSQGVVILEFTPTESGTYTITIDDTNALVYTNHPMTGADPLETNTIELTAGEFTTLYIGPDWGVNTITVTITKAE